ncbi:ATP synthase subunit D [Spironucleus salmonicida]|uniref:ATP synthase subunit D n=1 Tax=Spironucleus salmonicida TaxID=348837 RepID=V6LFK1_9EUKA|nr:ATP synthase subunit D [Spironucleus salmonicida]|eukprot:EST43320.1 ATP synthase subunit D [Spironucleus salmonicida]
MEQIIPTKAMLMQLKTRRLSAVRGHALLKKKVDALNGHYRKLQAQIQQETIKLHSTLKDSFWSLTVAQRSVSADINPMLRAAVSRVPTLCTRSTITNIAGVRLPQLEIVKTESDIALGVGSGGAGVKWAQKVWEDSMAYLVKVAGMQASFQALQEVILQTNRRVNALEYVMIPKLETNIKYIEEALEEDERESFFKMKMVSNKKAQEMEEQGITDVDEGRKTGLVRGIGEDQVAEEDNLF